MGQPRVESLGWCPVKGTTWHQEASLRLDRDGVPGDRMWSPVTPDLVCVKATDVPQLAGLRVEQADLPGAADACCGGAEQTVRYYDRHFPATVHDGELARRISEVVGRRVLLAHTTARRGFVWSSPVSLLLRSELAELPGDTGRYRPNLVLDDRAEPLALAVGSRIRLGEVELVVERELDRCLVVNHHPTTGEKDADLLRRLRPGVLLGHGCRVEHAGELQVA